MPTNKKIDIVSDLTEKLTAAKSVVLADYRGLTTSQIEDLRQKIEEAGGTFIITKNTLLQLALQNAKCKMQNIKLKEPTATLFSFSDEIAPIKALAKFTKEWELPIIKLGFLGKDLISTERINEMAKLPSRNELLTQIVGLLQIPTYGLVSVLKGNVRKLVYLMQAINKQKTRGGEKES